MRIRFTPLGLGTPGRARRVARKKAPTSSLRLSRATRGPHSSDHNVAALNDYSDQRTSRDPVPGQNHPIHNSAQRSEWGHHMYSTGMFTTGLGRMGAPLGTLKLYSHGPIDETSYTKSHHQKFRRSFQSNTELLSGGIWSAFYYLYLVALDGLRSQEHSRDAHAQIFSPPAQSLQSLKFRPGKRLMGSARTWNLFCRLAKSADGRDVLSRPWLSFQSSPARISHLCSVRADGQVAPEMALFLVLAGHLKANGHEEARDYTKGSALQSIADDLATQSLDAVVGQDPFTSTGAIMEAIRHRLLSIIPSSSMASALDLNHLGITLQFGDARKRLVQNILLNDDGSVKTDVDMPISLPVLESNSAVARPSANSCARAGLQIPVARKVEPREAVGKPTKTARASTWATTVSWSFSDTTQSKLDSQMTWSILNENGMPLLQQQRLALQELDIHGESVDTLGLAALVDAAKLMYQASPSSSGFALRGTLRSLMSSASATSVTESTHLTHVKRWPHVRDQDMEPSTLRFIQNTTTHQAKIGVHLPGILGIQARLGKRIYDLHAFISLEAGVSYDNDTSTSSTTSTISDEIVYLRKAADVIVGRVCQATSFESVQACIETMAEAVLRFTRFRSANLDLNHVRIRAFLEHTQGEITSVKSRVSFDLGGSLATSGDNGMRTVKVTTGEPIKLHATTGQTVRDDEHRSMGASLSTQEDESAGLAETSASSEAAPAELDLAPTSTATRQEPTSASEENAESVSDNGSVGDVAVPLEEVTVTDSSGVPTSITKGTNLRFKSKRDCSIDTELIAGVECPHFDSKVVRSKPFQHHIGLDTYRCTVHWAPRHATALNETSPLTIDDIAARALLQSEPSSLQALFSTAMSIMAAMPFDPWRMTLYFTHITGVEDPHLKVVKRALGIAIHLRGERGVESTKRAWSKRPCTFEITLPAFEITLPALEFDVSDPEAAQQDPKEDEITVHCVLQGSLAGKAGTDVLAQVHDLSEAVRDIIQPILSDVRTLGLDDATEKCTRAVLLSDRPLAALLHVDTVELKTDTLKRRDRQRPSHATATRPGAFIDARFRKYIAIGSNVGDRIEALESACRTLDGSADVHVVETSPLYETEPMYVEDQDRFLNGVCEIRTELSPLQLLDRLQAIENDLGRHKTIDKGPRNIDLDILTYGQRTVATERLTVPHALMMEREFVLRPLCDTSGFAWRDPIDSSTAERHRSRLPASSTPMYPITAMGAGLEPLRSLDPKRKTQVMSILNVTPDSFSDGGANQPTDLNTLRDTILANIAAGATIIDIGGQSSRPNAEDVSAEEEISRILPAIELIKTLPEAKGIAISIDTYRAKVAEAAINAGAHIINDISAGLLDPDMLSTVSRLGCTYIMMHMRGTPATMQNEENTSYPDGLLPTVAYELLRRLHAARDAGIRRWRIILDPGIGFAKTLDQNVELLKRFGELRNWDELSTYPWLVGTSRKGFIGKITGVTDAKDRVSGTAATVTAAVQGGAEIVRVHDVKEMAEVVKMADAMYRS